MKVRNVLEAAAATLAAFLFYTLLGRLDPALSHVLNPFNLVIIYFAFAKGEVFGAALGTAAGLIQDSFSVGVFGLAGLTKTIMGFLLGYFPRKINLVPFFRNLVFIFIIAAIEIGLWTTLYVFIFREKANVLRGLIFLEPAATALAGSLVLWAARRLKSRKA
jgi:rod shape-determining protein MreD